MEGEKGRAGEATTEREGNKDLMVQAALLVLRVNTVHPSVPVHSQQLNVERCWTDAVWKIQCRRFGLKEMISFGSERTQEMGG